MPEIIFISPDDQKFTVTARVGDSLMEVAVDNDIPGIDADCSGGCACATCHILWPESHKNLAPPPEEDEQYLLDFLDNLQVNSRLSCQITVKAKMDGMMIRIPRAS